MRISDWSSDVCSSDLEICCVHRPSPQVVKKLPASEPMVSAQPSTSTNSSSLNGSETSVGDSILMPSDISTAAPTRSIPRTGRKVRKRAQQGKSVAVRVRLGGTLDSKNHTQVRN